ncbi:MAG TPA: hypothetical protein PLL30_12335 [Candidatus Krumholzibacteria bacterium]|nr:hypothetical protein [Candidatus Krumholzibacteria bacterium]HPD72556.1 hypothetical protein [Candidatus Krumholzibacteria bacterium]HRY40512.1 hypothetical protein [Candidatus Krumholzibacteria bacterium]
MAGLRTLGWLALAATLAILASARSAAAESDWNRVDDPMQGAVGVHAGKIGGSGLAFKGPLQWFLQLQVAGGIWNTSSDKRHNLGVELQYLLRQDPRLRLYLVTGVGRTYHKERHQRDGGVETWSTSTSWNTGFGVGVEYLLHERWACQVDADFTYQGDDETITLWPQAGILFYW